MVKLFLKRQGDFVNIAFPFSREMLEKVKMIPGRRWTPDEKVWKIPVEFWNHVKDLALQGEYELLPSKEVFLKPHLFISEAYKNQLRIFSIARKVQARIVDKYPFIDKYGLLTETSEKVFEQLIGDNEILVYSKKELIDFVTIKWQVEHVKINNPFFKGQLFPFQNAGANSLVAFRNFMLLDEMGLGKTVQAIFAALRMRERGRVNRVMILAPASLKYQWQKEIEKFSDAKTVVIEGNKEKRNSLWFSESFFYIANYELLRFDFDIIEEIHWDLVIADEVQRIKTWSAKTTKMLKKINSFYRFALTGTPVENHLGELFSICEWVNPDILGWWKTFNDRYCVRDRFGKIISYKNLGEIHAKIRGIMLRRTKEEVIAQLPDVYENNYFCDLCPASQKMYEDMETEVKTTILVARQLEGKLHAIEAVEEKLKEADTPQSKRDLKNLLGRKQIVIKTVAKMRGEIISLFVLLLEVCDSAELLGLSSSPLAKKLVQRKEYKKVKSVKILELEKILCDLGKDKVVIFTKYERMQRLINKYLVPKGYKIITVSGKVSPKEQEIRVNLFKGSKQFNILLTTDCLAYGKNIQEANHVINFDLPFNPAKLLQRNARIVRIDSKHDKVHVIYIVTNTPIEKNILEVLFSKISLSLKILNPEEFARGNLEKLGISGISKLIGIDKVKKTKVKVEEQEIV